MVIAWWSAFFRATTKKRTVQHPKVAVNYCYIISLILIIHICLFGECFSKCKCIIYIYICRNTRIDGTSYMWKPQDVPCTLEMWKLFVRQPPLSVFLFLGNYLHFAGQIYIYITILCICSLVKLLFKEICRTHRHTHNLYDRQNHAFQSKCPHTTIYWNLSMVCFQKNPIIYNPICQLSIVHPKWDYNTTHYSW